MKYTPAFAFILTISAPISAFGASVYSGCAVPALKSTHRTFYVDPVNGSLSGDGSAAKPWSTLADVVNPANKLVATQGHAGSAFNAGKDTALHPVNPTAPIKAGDLILLKSGNHGSPTVTNMYNSDFITVAAAPGATPVVGKMAIVSSGKWTFQGLKFQGLATTATGATAASPSPLSLVTAGRGDWEGLTTDIVFSDNSFSAADSTSGWNKYDWINKPYSIGLWAAVACVSTVDNHFYNLLNAAYVSAEKNLVQGNLIEAFSNDGLDIQGSNLLIKGNTIRGGVNTAADPYHADGIQGWSAISNGVAATNSNVVIDGNILTKTGSGAASYMQGISIFDGKWTGLVIQNNVVNVDTWHGIAVFGAKNSRIVNNTVIASDPAAQPSWITVQNAKDGTVSSGVTVRDNIATQYIVQDSNTVFDHNVAALKITIPVSGKSTVFTSGTAGNANAVLPTVLAGFMTLNTTAGSFNERLRSTSPAVGFGSPTLAPSLDILGKARIAPIDAGAYVH